MSFTAAIKVKGVKEIKRDLKRIKRDITPKLEQRAINFAIRRGNTDIRRRASAALGIGQKALKRRIKIRKAKLNGSGLVVVLVKPILVSTLGKSRQTRQGVSVARAVYPGSFKAVTRRGFDGVFERITKSRYPIKPVTIPVDPILTNKARQSVFNYMPGEFVREFERIARVALRGKSGSRFNIK